MDRYYWRAVYNDGTGISQLEINPATGLEWSSAQVDLSKLKAIVLEPKRHGVPRAILHVQPGEIPTRFWRHRVCAMGPGQGQKTTCWCLTLEKNGVIFGAFFRPDGSIVLTTDTTGTSSDMVI